MQAGRLREYGNLKERHFRLDMLSLVEYFRRMVNSLVNFILIATLTSAAESLDVGEYLFKYIYFYFAGSNF